MKTNVAVRFGVLWVGLLCGVWMATRSTGADWIVDTVAGTGVAGVDEEGALAVQSKLNNPFGVVRGPEGTIWFCEYDGQVVREIDAEGRLWTRVGNGKAGYDGDGGDARKASLNQPHEIRFDREGNLYIADMRNHVIRRVDRASGIITTYAGTGVAGHDGDEGPADRALLRQPHSIQFGPTGDLYICDIGNHVIRRVDVRTGRIHRVAGTGQPGVTPGGAPIEGTPLNGPRSIDFDADGNMWLATREGNQVFRLDLEEGRIHHMAGTGRKGFEGNGGMAREANLSGPKGIAVGVKGRVYLVDTESHSIRMIDSGTGILSVVVGTGLRGDGPDGVASGCRLARPHGIWVDPDGTLWIGDSENHRIRRVRRSGL